MMDQRLFKIFRNNKLFFLVLMSFMSVPNLSTINADVTIRHGPSHQRVRSRSTVTFRCLVDVEPVHSGQTIVEWKKDDELLDMRRDSRLDKHPDGQSLTIRNVSTIDTGLYTCIARLNDDTDTASAQLVVEDVPDPPIDVQLAACSARVVQLQWRLISENYSPVIQFIIEYNTTFRPDIWQVAKTQLPRDRYYQRIALSPWGNYSFRIIAQNSIGTSRPSLPTSDVCSTPPDMPHINPKGVCSLNVKSHTLVVTWEPMPEEEHNAPGFYYLVRWRRHDLTANPTNYEERTVDKASNTLVIDGQPVYKPYEIYVLAINEIGEAVSPPRMVIAYSGEDVPLEVPQNFRLDPNKAVSDKTADFIWTPVNTGPWRIQGFFRGYKIQFWKRDDPSTMREHSIIYGEPGQCWRLSTNGRQRREESLGHIYNLWPFTNITAHILVLNAKYEGLPSPSITFSTKEGVPGPVGHFSVIGRGFNQLRLAWEKPTFINGIFIGYTLTYTVVNPTQSPHYNSDEQIEIDEPNLTRLKLKGLLPEHTYRLTICGRTKIGKGPVVVSEARTLREGPPTAPDFTTSNVSKRAVNVTWFPSKDGGIFGTVFTIHYRKQGHVAWTLSDEETNRNWTLIEGFDPGITYEMRVIARNGDDTDSPETSSAVKPIRIGMKRDIIQPTFKVTYPDSTSIQISLAEFDPSAYLYYVQYRQHDVKRWRTTEDVRTMMVTTIKDLIPGRKYQVQVLSKSDLGESTSLAQTFVVGKDPDAQASVGADNSSSSIQQCLLSNYLLHLSVALLVTHVTNSFFITQTT